MPLVARASSSSSPSPLRGRRVGVAQLGQSPVQLGLHQGGIGQQGGHLAPDELIEVIGPHRLVLADASVLVAVVVRSETAVVVQLALLGARRRPVVRVTTALTRHETHEQRRFFGVARGEAAVVLEATRGQCEDLFAHDGGHGDRDPVFEGARLSHGVARHALSLPTRRAVDAGALLEAGRFQEPSPAGIGGLRSIPQTTERSQRSFPVRVTTPSALSQRVSSAIEHWSSAVAAEHLSHHRSLFFDDLITCVGTLGSPYIAVAERGAREHVDRAGPGAMRLATSRALGDLRAFVFGDHALELNRAIRLRASHPWVR